LIAPPFEGSRMQTWRPHLSSSPTTGTSPLSSKALWSHQQTRATVPHL
jgi:hypothetical protein